MGKMQGWNCPTCNRVLKISGILIQNDESGTSTIMYDCPVCGKADIKNRLGDVMCLTETLPEETFMGRLRYMVNLVDKTDKILAKLERKTTLKIYNGGLING